MPEVPVRPSTPPPRKRILVFCDGTGNDFTSPNVIPDKKGSGENSNVIKLYSAACIDNDQVGYYHPGVGTMGAPTATHRLTREWSRIKGLAFGAGFRDNVFDAYRYLMNTYEENGGNGNEDEVFLFGFSRGAYTVRALAGLLAGYGLLCRGNEGHLPYAWRMYLDQHGHRDQRKVEPDKSFRDTFSHKNFKIRFMGVWDTVSSVGWIYTPLRLFNIAYNPIIQTSRHAISIDEHRSFFPNNLIGPDGDVVQAWFAGVHSDVGGSYPQPEAGLAQVPLRWMLEEAKAAGMTTNPVREDAIFGIPEDPPQEIEPVWYQAPTEDKLHNSLKGLWWVPEIVPHLYFEVTKHQEYYRVPLGLRRRKLPPDSLVHPSVAARMDTPAFKYSPPNVRREELLTPQQAGVNVPPSADGATYLVFKPINRKPLSPVVLFLDRYIVTWAFSIFDLFLFLPALIWAAAVILISVPGLVLKAFVWLIHQPVLATLWRWSLRWPRKLWCSFVFIVRWCWTMPRA